MLNVKCERLKCVTGRKTNLEISMATGKKTGSEQTINLAEEYRVTCCRMANTILSMYSIMRGIRSGEGGQVINFLSQCRIGETVFECFTVFWAP